MAPHPAHRGRGHEQQSRQRRRSRADEDWATNNGRDTVHHAIHLEHPGWYYTHDALADQVAATRRRLFTWAAGCHTLVFAPHLPPAAAGHVIPAGEGWRWEPV